MRRMTSKDHNKKQTEQNLKERIAELRGLYTLNSLADSNTDKKEVLETFVREILPASLHQPKDLFACLTVDDEVFMNTPFQREEMVQAHTVPLIIGGKERGALAFYTENREFSFYDTFEEELISGFADKLSKYLTRLEAIETIGEREEQLRDILDSLPDMIFSLTDTLIITWANRKALDINNNALGMHCYKAYLDRDRPCANCPAEKALETGEVKKGSIYFAEIDGVQGETLWESLGVPLVRSDGHIEGVIEIARDVTDHMKAQENLRNLASHLQSVREEERTAISREIHDELGQALTALKMDLYWLTKHLPEQNEYYPKMKQKTEGMLEIIDHTVSAVQRLMTQLRPVLLDDLDLCAAIEWETEEFAKRTGIHYMLDLDLNGRELDNTFATTIFRIFQEALTNIARHADATAISVSLRTDDSSLILDVSDDGTGIEQSKITDTQSFGLIGMKERALSRGGDVLIRRNPEKGTTVHAVVPLPKNTGNR
jgi:PAS domain S-box-containing protein